MGPTQESAAGRHRVGDTPRQQQVARPLGEEPVAAGVLRSHQRDRAVQQAGGGRGRPRGCLLGSPGEPADGLAITLGCPAGEMLGDPQGRRSRPGQPLRRLAVQPAAHAGREVLVETVAEQVVTEAQRHAVVFDHPRPDRLGQRRRQLGGQAGGDGQVGQRERRTQDRRRPQRPQRVLGQEAAAGGGSSGAASQHDRRAAGRHPAECFAQELDLGLAAAQPRARRSEARWPEAIPLRPSGTPRDAHSSVSRRVRAPRLPDIGQLADVRTPGAAAP